MVEFDVKLYVVNVIMLFGRVVLCLGNGWDCWLDFVLGSFGLCGVSLVGVFVDGDLMVYGRQYGFEGGSYDVGIDVDIEVGWCFVQVQLDVIGGFGIGIGIDGVFMEVYQFDVQVQCMYEGVNRIVVVVVYCDWLVIVYDVDFDVDGFGFGGVF